MSFKKYLQFNPKKKTKIYEYWLSSVSECCPQHGRRHNRRVQLQMDGSMEKADAVEVEAEVVEARAEMMQRVTNYRSASAHRRCT